MDKQQAIKILKRTLPGKFFLPDQHGYKTDNSTFYTEFQNVMTPIAIAKPASTADVSHLMKALNPLLKKQQLRIAIRGTGHTLFAGSSNISEGITIHLDGLKGIRLNEDKSIVEIGVGETWGTVYAELEKHGLTTAGGRVARVGVGGLVLGGGLSLYSTRRGFACDSVTEFEVVLADGSIVDANEQENASLWTALRGGLNNFGVVTSFKMRTFEVGKVWGGIAVYPGDSFPQIMQATVDFAENEADEDTHVIASTGYHQGFLATMVCMYHTKAIENAPSLRRFTDVPGLIKEHSSLRTSIPSEFYQQLSDYTKDGCRSFWMTFTIKPNFLLMQKIHQAWSVTLESLKDAEGFSCSLCYSPLTKALLINSQKAGGNAMDIDPEDGPLLVIMLQPVWSSIKDDERVHRLLEEWLAKAKALASESGMLHRYLFANYTFQTSNYFEGCGEKNLARLRETSRKFDPDGIFQKAVPGGFKLGM